MSSFWNSADAVSTAAAIARWAGAAIAIAILVLGHRLSTLQGIAKSEERKKTEAAIEDARIARKLAEPTTLKFEAASRDKEMPELSATIFLRASKNESLGKLEFTVAIVGESTAKIEKLWPSLKGGAYQTGDKSFQLAEDGKSATLFYVPLGVEMAAFDITLTAPAIVLISGNRMPESHQVRFE